MLSICDTKGAVPWRALSLNEVWDKKGASGQNVCETVWGSTEGVSYPLCFTLLTHFYVYRGKRLLVLCKG